MKQIKIEKVYTFPGRKLYGEFCHLSLLELRLKICKGEITESLCLLDENGFANVFDEYGNLDWGGGYSGILDEELKILGAIIKAQMNKRILP